MRTTRIEDALPRPLGAPLNWSEQTDAHCGDLFIRPETIDGIMYMRSAWEMDAHEPLMMLAGAKLILGIAGNVHPVVNMGVDTLPQDFDPVVMARHFTTPTGEAAVRVEMLFAPSHRATVSVMINGDTFPAAVAIGITSCEKLARSEGWLPSD